MSARTSDQKPAAPSLDFERRYHRIWTAAASLAVAVWAVVALVQSPTLPLLGLSGALGALGGVLFVRAPASTPRARHEYVAGALAVAGLVLVVVGIGHHLETGLAIAALVVVSSPSLMRWIAGA